MGQLHYRMDLDKTYLATPYEEKRALLKIALERAEEKRTLPGMAALVQGLKECAPPRYSAVTLTIVSASPRWMERVVRGKLKLDRIPADHLILKDHWRLLQQGRFRELLNPGLFKITVLLQLARSLTPEDREVLIGDDWDMDPFLYTFYAALRQRNLPHWVWEKTLLHMEVPLPLLDELERLRANLAVPEEPPLIYIRRERRRGRAFYEQFGSSLSTYDDTFQLALLLFDEGLLERKGVSRVVEELREYRWRLSTFSFSWEALREDHLLKRYPELEGFLRQEGLLPPFPFRSRHKPKSPEPQGADWEAILRSYGIGEKEEIP